MCGFDLFLIWTVLYSTCTMDPTLKTHIKPTKKRIDKKNKKESPATVRPYVSFKGGDGSSGHTHDTRDHHRNAAGYMYLLTAYT